MDKEWINYIRDGEYFVGYPVNMEAATIQAKSLYELERRTKIICKNIIDHWVRILKQEKPFNLVEFTDSDEWLYGENETKIRRELNRYKQLYGELPQSQKQQSMNNIPEDIESWIEKEGFTKYPKIYYKAMQADLNEERRELFTDGATALYQHLQSKLEEKDKEIGKLKNENYFYFNNQMKLTATLKEKDKEIERLKENKKAVIEFLNGYKMYGRIDITILDNLLD